MTTKSELLKRIECLRRDIYESARCITNMLETIDEEQVISETSCQQKSKRKLAREDAWSPLVPKKVRHGG